MGQPTSTQPYLLRAVYEWCVDNGYTPHISVEVDSRTRVPSEYVRDGQIVLNIGPGATERLRMGNDLIECLARFSGKAQEVVVPVVAVTAIYARETGQGMSFEKKTGSAPAPSPAGASGPTAEGGSPPKAGGKPGLRRVK